MVEMWKAVVMGIVEGATEFIPVSSTGHLILVGHWLGWTDQASKTFEVFIQMGAILAVVVAYPWRFAGLLNPARRDGFSGMRGVGCLALTTLPAILVGMLTHDFIEQYLFSPKTVGIGLAIGGLWILIQERYPRRKKEEPSALDALTWRQALGVGCFQCLALWPGMSRSSSTILGGMLLGLNRSAAAEYSFFAAVPILTLATIYVLCKPMNGFSWELLPVFLAGFVVSFVSALLAVKIFIRIVSRYSLSAFGWYRLVVAALVWVWM